jgi:predicted Zn-dependent protease
MSGEITASEHIEAQATLTAPVPAPPAPAAAAAAEAPLQPGQQRVALADVVSQISQFEQANKLDEADDLAQRALKAVPEHPHILHMAGIVAYRKGRVAQALEMMEKSMALAPNVALYPRNMCEIYRGASAMDRTGTAG